MPSKPDKQEYLLKAETSQHIQDIESLYKELYKNPQCGLLLSTNLKNRTLGTHASLIQLINTWSRFSSGDLYTYINEERFSESQLINFSNEFHGIVALYMASGKEILNRTGSFSVKKIANQVLAKKLALYKENSVKFRSSYDQRDKGIMLACFDDTICEYPPYFYTSYPSSAKHQVQPESAFIALVNSILTIISRVELSRIRENYRQNDKKNIQERLGTVAKELIENTEWWAKLAFNSRIPYKPNVRGMLLQFNTQEWEKPSGEDKDPMDKYVSGRKCILFSDNEKQLKKKSLGFFELSVYDSGPGLARRWSGKDYPDLTVEEEYKAVLNCLQENKSTDGSSISTMRGFGLPNVLRAIGKDGFLRLRSGRLSLYRNFSQTPLDQDTELSENRFLFNDWVSGKAEFSEMAISEGTLFTIIYPFTY